MKRTIKIIAGLFIISTAIFGYSPQPKYMYELTFLSNFFCGLLLFADGITEITRKKSLPAILYQIILPCTNVVFFTVIFQVLGLHSFNFDGMFFFLHIINPPLFLLIYLFCTELNIKDKRDYLKRVFVSPVLVMIYALFDLIRFIITGNLVYGLISTDKIGVASVTVIGVSLYLLIAFMGYGLIELKLFAQKKVKCREEA